MKQADRKTKLATEGMDAELASLVRGIGASDRRDIFGTPMTGLYGDLPTQEEGMWLEAWKNPQTGLWTVERHTRQKTGTDGNPARKQEAMAREICLFDAVHLCASFHLSFQGAGDEGSAVVLRPDFPLFRDVAEESLIPFDKMGLPHPAAHGRILTDGDFDDKAYEIAARTRGQKIILVKQEDHVRTAATALAVLPPSRALVTEGTTKSIASADLIMKETKKLREAFECASSVYHVLQALENTNFAKDRVVWGLGPGSCDSPGPLFVSALSLGLLYIPFVAARHVAKCVSSERCYDRFDREDITPYHARYRLAKRRLKSKAAGLKNEDARTMMNDFIKAADLAYGMERAAAIYSQCRAGDLPSRKLYQGEKILVGALKRAGADQATIDAQQSAYANGGISESGRYLVLLREKLREMERYMESALKPSR